MRSTSKMCGPMLWRVASIVAAVGAAATELRRSTCALMPSNASRSINGPTSVAKYCVSPTDNSFAAPRNMWITLSAISSCRHSRRNAEQRCPAERKADCTTASTTCSGNAVESTNIALMPPVSAISGTMGPSLLARLRWMILATWVEPVKTTPATFGCATNAAPMVSPSPMTHCSASVGTPAACSNFTASSATSGVCSAGFATTVLPVTNAAATCPMNIASGKFHGLMHTHTPRPRGYSMLLSPVGPGSVIGAQTRSASSA